MKILITGIAGFIGYHLALELQKQGHNIVGIDNYNALIYPCKLKHARSALLKLREIQIYDFDFSHISDVFDNDYDMAIHLAAHANPRIAREHPLAYIENNIVSTQKLIRWAEKIEIPTVLYASSSSVLVGNTTPWTEDVSFQHHTSPYGWSKFVNECQFKNSDIPNTTGLRFFTVYGPWGRPDMATYSFTRNILRGESIGLYEQGTLSRDFTYIDDIVDGVSRIIKARRPRHELFNIGRGKPTTVSVMVNAIERHTGKIANRVFAKKPRGEPTETWADITKLQSLGYNPTVSIDEGIGRFVEWYKEHHT